MVVIAVIVLIICMWAVGLLYIGWGFFQDSGGFSNRPDPTETAYVVIIPPLIATVSPTDTSLPSELTNTPEPTALPLPSATSEPSATFVPTATPIPTQDDQGLVSGRVTTQDYNFYNPAVSPDHQALVAAVEVGDNWQIVEIDPASGLITRP